MTQPLGPMNVEMANALRQSHTDLPQEGVLGFAIGFEAAWTLLHSRATPAISPTTPVTAEQRAQEAVLNDRCSGR